MSPPQDVPSKATERILRAELMAPHLASAVIPRLTPETWFEKQVPTSR